MRYKIWSSYRYWLPQTLNQESTSLARECRSDYLGTLNSAQVMTSTAYELIEYMDERFKNSQISELSSSQVQEVSDYNNIRQKITNDIIHPALDELGLMSSDETGSLQQSSNLDLVVK